MRIIAAESTPLFAGTAARPLQIVAVTLAGGTPGGTAGPVHVRVEGPGVTTPQPRRITGLAPGAEPAVEVPVAVAAPHRPGSTLPVTVIAESPASRSEHGTSITVAEPGWTIWMVSHFHYDPVWWDTQGQFTQTRLLLPGEDGELPEVRTAFELVRLHLDAARDDPDYKFVLAEIDYLKPYFDVHPEDRADLRTLLAEGRIEIVGGNYNEPNTNLTSAESTIRNAVYGIGHQRDVAGGDPRAAWMLDAFGHDPGYPGLMAAAGLTESAWARGPYHQWGPRRTVGDNERMQFPSEFEWVSPDGAGLLTSYMPNHYGAGWGLHRAADLAGARAEALDQLASLAPVAATRNVLLPVGADHVIPARWATAVHRDFRDRYLWPRCVTALPREFFAAVRAEAAERGIWLLPQTRDMNPVYPGKDVSYIDTKQAQRAAEVAVSDGERLATLAWLAGAEYPAESLDRAWRQLVFGAHHDAITGTESDQVYLDLLGGWREAFELGDEARRAAVAHLAALADTSPPVPANRDRARPLIVVNTLSWPREGLATITLTVDEPGTPWLAVYDESGDEVACLAEGRRHHADGSLAEITLSFRSDVPALGYRTFWALPAPPPAAGCGWDPLPGTAIGNEEFDVEADPCRGGTLTRVYGKRAGTELLAGPGNELVLQEEYDYHPRWGEGPWLLSPKGPGQGSAGVPATVVAERCPIGERLTAEFVLGGLRVTQQTVLWHGADRVEFRTHVDGSIGQDRLLRVRVPVHAPGTLPIYQTATAVVGRPFGTPDADVARHAFTLDNPAHEWFGLGSAARVQVGGQQHAIGVAEVILPGTPASDDPAVRQAVRDLVAALAAQGVTATCSQPDGPRYGALDVDSNLPDCRVALGGPRHNPWTARLLSGLGPAAADLAGRLAAAGGTRVWLPGRPRTQVFGPDADVRGERDLPVLIVAGTDLASAITAITHDLGDAVVAADPAGGRAGHERAGAGEPEGAEAGPPLASHSVALLNRGTPGSLATPDGTLHVSLMRASSAWPSGVWIDGEKRAVPDGSSFAWQHWSHTFEYAMAAAAGDWRDAGFTLAGQDYNHDLLTCETDVHTGPLPGRASLAAVSPAGTGAAATGAPLPRPPAMLTALKPRGNPLASGRPGRPQRQAGVTVRLRDAGAGPAPEPARVALFTGITAAHVTGLREDTDGPALPVVDGEAVAQVPAASIVTVAVTTPPAHLPGTGVPVAERRPGGTAGTGTAGTGTAGTGTAGTGTAGTGTAGTGLAGPAQPVFTRYWLHGTGPAPAGNLPVAVHLSPDRVALAGPAGQPEPSGPGPAGPGTATSPTLARDAGLTVSVACGPEPAAGDVVLDVPAGLTVHLPGGRPARPLAFRLPPGGHARWDLAVRVSPGATPGRYFVAARIHGGSGRGFEDAALVTVGEPAGPPLDLPLADLMPLLDADQRATAAEIGLALAPSSLALTAGHPATLSVTVANGTAGPVRGECELISPFGTWDLMGRPARGFSAGPGQAAVLTYRVRAAASARPGAHWWALAKVSYFGRVRYSEAVPVAIAR